MRTQHFTTEEAERIATELKIDFASASFDVEQFRKGLDVELEHGRQDPETDITNDDPLLTGKIAWAHLKERPDYYSALAIMEATPPVQQERTINSVMPLNVMSSVQQHPSHIRVQGQVYTLVSKPAPEYIRVAGVLFRKVAKRGGKWSILPKGWTRNSAKSFWESIGESVTKCRHKLEDVPGIDDTGSFCASLKDLMEGTTTWRKPTKKKATYTQPRYIRVDGRVYRLAL